MSFLVFSSLLPVLWKSKSLKREIDKKHSAASEVQEVNIFFKYLMAFNFYENLKCQENYVKILSEGGDGHWLPWWRLNWLFVCSLQKIRTSITQLLWAGKEFKWWRHCSITVALLVFTNILVIFVPTIRDIFGFIGKHLHISSSSLSNLRKCSSNLI